MYTNHFSSVAMDRQLGLSVHHVFNNFDNALCWHHLKSRPRPSVLKPHSRVFVTLLSTRRFNGGFESQNWNQLTTLTWQSIFHASSEVVEQNEEDPDLNLDLDLVFGPHTKADNKRALCHSWWLQRWMSPRWCWWLLHMHTPYTAHHTFASRRATWVKQARVLPA